MLWWKHGLAVSLGLLVSQVNAQEGGNSSPGSTTAGNQNKSVQLNRPVAFNPSRPSNRPGVQMGKPVAVLPGNEVSSPSAIMDQKIQQTSFDNKAVASTQGNVGDNTILASVSSNTTGNQPATMNPMFAWKQTSEEIAPAPRLNPGSASSGFSAPAPAIPLNPSSQPIPDPPALHSVWTPELEAGVPSYNPGNIYKTNEIYIKAEALLWRFKGDPIPTLGTTNGFNTVVGGNNENNKAIGGARLTAGYWFDDLHNFGIEASGFALGKQSQTQSFSTFGANNLFVPVILANNGATLLPLAGPINGSTGLMQLHTITRLSGAELNARTNWINGANGFVDLLAGFRAVDLQDKLNLTAINSSNLSNGLLLQRTISDQFQTKNQFFGGQIGSVAEYHFGKWVIDLTGKVALGTTRESVNLGGSTIYTSAAGTSGAATGLFSSANNAGFYTRNQFSVIPEAGVTIGYNFTENLRGFCGYNFMYMSRVARPGQQINPNLSPSQATALAGSSAVPAAGLPFGFQSGDFWAQGITLGLEWRY